MTVVIDANVLLRSTPDCSCGPLRVARSGTRSPDFPAIPLRILVSTCACHGKVAPDARYVAAMRTHGLDQLLTFNVGDFARFPGLTVIDPASVATVP